MLHRARWLMLLIAAAVTLQSKGDGGIRLPDQPPKEETEGRSINFGGDEQSRSPQAQGRGLLDWLGLGEDQDPYIQQSTQQCINGDLADCFKAQALRSFDDFFDKAAYQLSENALLVKVEKQARALAHEPPTLSSQPRSEDSEWDGLVKYGMRKIERFLRSTALEMHLDDDVTSNGVIAPRFLDEIADEVDIIEDKKAPPFLNLSVLIAGLGLAWPSPVLVALREPTNPVLSRPITDNEGAWIVSIGFLVGAIITFLPGLLQDRIGRRPCVLLAAASKVIVGFLYIFATEPWMLLLGRSIQGASDTFIFSSVSIYASEIASTKVRGALGTILQIMSSVGIVFMLSVGPFVAYITINIIYTVIIIISFIPLLFLPESPYFLYKKGREAEAVKLLTFLRGTEELAHDELKQYDLSKSSETVGIRHLLTTKTSLNAVGIVIVIGIGTQLVGFNAVTFYLQTVLESTQTNIAPEIASVVVGLIQLLASVCSSMVTDRLGRKPILSSTLIGMALGMVGLGTFFFVREDTEEISGFLNFLPLVSLILVVFSFSAGLGSVMWSLSAELFDGPSRAIGMAVSNQTFSIFVFLTTFFFPALTSSIGPAPTYWIFSVNCVLLCAFIVFFVPETKGKTIAEIQEALGPKLVATFEISERYREFKEISI